MRQAPKNYDRKQKHYQTGYWGVWSERSERFCFGVQAVTKREALDYIRKKTRRPVKRTQFRVKGISERHAHDFFETLKWRDDFAQYKEENEAFKAARYKVTNRAEVERMKRDVQSVLLAMKGDKS